MSFDAAKDASNVAKHGISLSRAGDLAIEAMEPDTRRSYVEPRFRAWGIIDGLPYCLGFTLRDGAVRPISLRRAHLKEFRRYAF